MFGRYEEQLNYISDALGNLHREVTVERHPLPSMKDEVLGN